MSEPDGRHISGYDPAIAEQLVAEAAAIIRSLGFAASHVVLIGFLVPGLLVPVLDPGLEPHMVGASAEEYAGRSSWSSTSCAASTFTPTSRVEPLDESAPTAFPSAPKSIDDWARGTPGVDWSAQPSARSVADLSSRAVGCRP